MKEEAVCTADDLKRVFGTNRSWRLLGKLESKEKNAQKRKIEFNLNYDDLLMIGEQWMGAGRCDYTDLPFMKETIDHPMYPSLERIDDKKGYVRGNICVVGVEINRLKDRVFDKPQQVTVPTELMGYMKILIRNLTPEKMEHLKKKYIPTKEILDKLKAERLSMYDDKEIPTEQAPIEQTPIADCVDLNVVVVSKPKVSELPNDVEVALGYAHLCQSMSKLNIDITLTFSQYKAVYLTKRCPFTGNELSEHFPIMLDRSQPLRGGNLSMTTEKVGMALNELMTATDMSVHELAAKFKKFV